MIFRSITKVTVRVDNKKVVEPITMLITMYLFKLDLCSESIVDLSSVVDGGWLVPPPAAAAVISSLLATSSVLLLVSSIPGSDTAWLLPSVEGLLLVGSGEHVDSQAARVAKLLPLLLFGQPKKENSMHCCSAASK